MPNWPRTISPRLTTPFAFPDGLESWSPSGKGQFRAFENIGRVWQEVYASWRILDKDGRAFLAAINRARREKLIWDIQHPHYLANYGVGGGTPLVDGASQTGSTLNIKGGPTTVTAWLRDGDLIAVAGIQSPFDVVADANTDGTGDAAVSIHPPIFTGQEPADAAVITITPNTIFFKAVLTSVTMPDIEAHGVVGPGMELVWREQPSA